MGRRAGVRRQCAVAPVQATSRGASHAGDAQSCGGAKARRSPTAHQAARWSMGEGTAARGKRHPSQRPAAQRPARAAGKANGAAGRGGERRGTARSARLPEGGQASACGVQRSARQ